MENLFETTNLDLNHVQVIVRGMYAVAEVDGVHQSEMVMLREFYDACRADVDGLADFDDLLARPFDGEEAKTILDTPVLRETFVRSTLLLAFADGEFSDQEREMIGKMADNLDVDGERLAILHDEVRDYLMAQFARVSNVEALTELRKSLG